MAFASSFLKPLVGEGLIKIKEGQFYWKNRKKNYNFYFND